MAKKAAVKPAPEAGDYDVRVTITIRRRGRKRPISAPSVPMYGMDYAGIVGVQKAVSAALIGLGEAKAARLAAGK